MREGNKMSKVLVVDDDFMNLRMAEMILLKHDYEVAKVNSGIKCLEYLKQEEVDLILLDVHMSQMDGFEVLKNLKEDERLAEIPVIFLTADNDKKVEIRGLKEGASDFITKPFIAEIMLQRVKKEIEFAHLKNHLKEEVEQQTKKARERKKTLERLIAQMMLTLANTIDAKDRYTNGHSIRVAGYAEEIAKRYGKTEKEQEDIYFIGLLHDIGKIGIPNAIINKSSKLTDEEYNLIKSHPQIGANILSNITEIEDIAIGAHWHHERYDGKGYPDGLKGEEIPEIARIISVADVYDTMTSKRSYRDVLPQNVVREEIEKGKGTQFDPHFAEIMLQIIDEDTEYHLREHS